MQVLSLFEKVQIGLITYKQFVTAIAQVYRRGINLVAVAKMDAVEVATNHRCHRVRRAVRHACVHHPLLVGVLQAACHVGTPHHAIRASQSRGVY